ncbi:MAG: hypothetical protein HC848_08200 [Limnobacter sp.]|nr:hypothetical protein [Limnobacter sp.]
MEELQAVLGVAVKRPAQVPGAAALRVSGNLEQHYSPDARLIVCSAHALADMQATVLTGFLPDAAPAHKQNSASAFACRALGWTPEFIGRAQALRLPVQVLANHPQAVARALYAQLRQADSDGIHTLIVEQPAAESTWEGIADRLRRAAS